MEVLPLVFLTIIVIFPTIRNLDVKQRFATTEFCEVGNLIWRTCQGDLHITNH